MLAKLLTLFIVVPIIELTLLLMIGDLTHWWVSWLIVIGSGVLGAFLVRWQGSQTWRRIRRELSAGRQPKDALLDAAMIFFAGALMLTPGVLTDLFGMSLLVPRCRRFYKRKLVANLKRRFNFGQSKETPPEAKPRSQIIDTYVVDSADDSGSSTTG